MPDYQRLPVRPLPGAMVVKLYHSGDTVRGYVRKVTDPSEDDVIFPGARIRVPFGNKPYGRIAADLCRACRGRPMGPVLGNIGRLKSTAYTRFNPSSRHAAHGM